MIRCPECGFKALEDNDTFYYCNECGINIKKVKQNGNRVNKQN